MYKAIVTLLLAVASGTAAAGWVEVDNHQVGTNYIDPTAVERSSNMAKALVLIDFKIVQGPPLDNPFSSSI